eukprot:Platyproteum_vivax@DN7579_c0_g1_i2.p1
MTPDNFRGRSDSATEIFPFILKEEKTILFNFCNPTTAFDTVLSVWPRVDGKVASPLFENDDGEMEECDKKSRLRASLAAGRYYLMLEGYDSFEWGGAYQIQISCEDTQASATNNTCPEDLTLNDGLSSFCKDDNRHVLVQGSTEGLRPWWDNADSTALFPFELEEAADLKLDTVSGPKDFDTVIQVYEDCEQSSRPLFENDDFDFFSGEYRSALDVKLPSGRYFFAVTGWGHGNFTASATCTRKDAAVAKEEKESLVAVPPNWPTILWC